MVSALSANFKKCRFCNFSGSYTKRSPSEATPNVLLQNSGPGLKLTQESSNWGELGPF